jgi:molybdopterin molybdotransferase
MGIPGSYRGIIRDSAEETEQKLLEVRGKTDLIILSGGVSEGDSDFIPRVLEKLGFTLHLTRSAIQPGKPIIFARRESQFCFGLAGNPVSSFVQFEFYVKPFLYKLMGFDYQIPSTWATMGGHYTRDRTERLKFIPAWLDPDHVVTPVEYHGSAHIEALGRANCLMDIPLGMAEIKKGDRVHVRPLR